MLYTVYSLFCFKEILKSRVVKLIITIFILKKKP